MLSLFSTSLALSNGGSTYCTSCCLLLFQRRVLGRKLNDGLLDFFELFEEPCDDAERGDFGSIDLKKGSQSLLLRSPWFVFASGLSLSSFGYVTTYREATESFARLGLLDLFRFSGSSFSRKSSFICCRLSAPSTYSSACC